MADYCVGVSRAISGKIMRYLVLRCLVSWEAGRRTSFLPVQDRFRGKVVRVLVMVSHFRSPQDFVWVVRCCFLSYSFDDI